MSARNMSAHELIELLEETIRHCEDLNRQLDNIDRALEQEERKAA